jgi:hypothetical protein
VNAGSYGAVSALFGFVNFVVHVAFLIVTLTMVRSRRPDAFFPFTMAAAIFVLQTVLNLIGPPLLGAFAVAASSSAGYMGMFAILSAFGTIMSVIAWTLMMIGLVKIASPPQEFSLNRPPGG